MTYKWVSYFTPSPFSHVEGEFQAAEFTPVALGMSFGIGERKLQDPQQEKLLCLSHPCCSVGEVGLCKAGSQKSGKNIPDAGGNVPVQAFLWELTEVCRQAAEELIGNNPLKDTPE